MKQSIINPEHLRIDKFPKALERVQAKYEITMGALESKRPEVIAGYIREYKHLQGRNKELYLKVNEFGELKFDNTLYEAEFCKAINYDINYYKKETFQKVIGLLKDELANKETYTVPELQAIIRKVYSQVNILKTASAKEIERYFEVKKRVIDGETIYYVKLDDNTLKAEHISY